MIIFRGIDSALRGDAVRAARAVLVTETFHLVAELAQRGRGRSAGQAAADDDDLKFAAIVRADEPGMILVVRAICPRADPAESWTRVFRS